MSNTQKIYNPYGGDYGKPTFRIFMDLYGEFTKQLKKNDKDAALATEHRIASVARACLTDTTLKTINEMMKKTPGTQLKWNFREKKAEAIDDDDE